MKKLLADFSMASGLLIKHIGGFHPSYNPLRREVDGFTYDEELQEPGVISAVATTYTSCDLREFAAAFIEVADWLDKRAELAQLELEKSK